jgi:hypothetical protein
MSKSRLSKFDGRLRQLVRIYIREGRYVPLLPGHSIYLEVTAGNGRRFARVFQETWRRIPLGDRRCLLRYWKAEGPSCGIILSPQVELVEFTKLIELAKRADFPVDAKAVAGLTSHLGHKLFFNAKDADRMPDAVVGDLIAHELADTFQMATGNRPFRYPNGYSEFICANGERWDRNLLEYHADVIAEGWGFNTNSVDRWASMDREG